MNKKKEAIQEFLRQIGSKGGKSRAANHDKKTLSRWAKLGGRPKKGSNKGKTA